MRFATIARSLLRELPQTRAYASQSDLRKFGKTLEKLAVEIPDSVILNPTKVKPVRIAVTGAAGQIGYSLLPRIANGEMLGPNQPVILHLIERPDAMKALDGMVMELQDCAFPLLHDIVPTSKLDVGFKNIDYALLVGSKPRGPGMERADVLKDNAKIFAEQGQALNDLADPDVLVLVVGNPANTNALITSANAPNIPAENITAMTRLDHDRALAQLALRTGCKISEIENFAIWGNHSATQYPDVNNTTIGGKWAKSLINDETWIREVFIPLVQKRGAAVIDARGKSSAASAADAAMKHMHDWVHGSASWVSMAIPSDGSYGVPHGLWSSFPVKCFGGGKYGIIDNIPIDVYSANKINASIDELVSEREAVKALLPNPSYGFVEIDKSKVFNIEYIKPSNKA